MAEIVNTRNWMVQLGNTTNEIASAIINQGLTLEGLKDLDPDDVKIMCQTARRPGGVLENGDTNLGVNVSVMMQLKLSTSVLAVQYYDTVWRPITPVIMA